MSQRAAPSAPSAVVLGLGDAGIVAGIVGAFGGLYVVVHELRRHERRVTRREINDLTGVVERLTDEQLALRELLLEQRRYIYKLVTLMIDAGMDPPPPPAPSYDPGEYT